VGPSSGEEIKSLSLVIKQTEPLSFSADLAVRWLTFLLRIRKVIHSNLGLLTGYRDFLQSHQVDPGIMSYSRTNITSFHILSNSLFTNTSKFRRPNIK